MGFRSLHRQRPLKNLGFLSQGRELGRFPRRTLPVSSSGGNLDNLDSDRRRPPRTPNPPLSAAGEKIRARWTPGDPGPARPRPVWRCVGAARRDILDLLIAPATNGCELVWSWGCVGPPARGRAPGAASGVGGGFLRTSSPASRARAPLRGPCPAHRLRVPPFLGSQRHRTASTCLAVARRCWRRGTRSGRGWGAEGRLSRGQSTFRAGLGEARAPRSPPPPPAADSCPRTSGRTRPPVQKKPRRRVAARDPRARA